MTVDDLGTRLKDIIDRHGPESVAFYFSTMRAPASGWPKPARGDRHAGQVQPLTIDGTAR